MYGSRTLLTLDFTFTKYRALKDRILFLTDDNNLKLIDLSNDNITTHSVGDEIVNDIALNLIPGENSSDPDSYLIVYTHDSTTLEFLDEEFTSVKT